MFFREVILPHVSASRGFFSERLRTRLFRRVVSSMGVSVSFRSGLVMKEPHRIAIGNNVSIQENCYLSGWGGITIGNDVSIGNGTKIVSSEHQYTGEGPIRKQPLIEKPVHIGNDIWIGMGVCILGGTVIHDHVVVGAGSVVKGELMPYGVYAGVPAKKIKDIA